MSEGSNNPDGAPTKYKEEYAEQVYKLCLLGATDIEIADFFEVCEATVNNWKLEYSEFLESIRKGKIIADSEIAKSLYEKGKGFEYKKAHPFKVKEVTYENGKRLKEIERIEVVMVDEVVPPDTLACKMWLINRRKSNWRDKQEIEHSGHLQNNGGVCRADEILSEFRSGRQSDSPKGDVQE